MIESFINLITEPLAFDFFVKALLALCMASILCAIIGTWVILRGLSYVGDAMSHAVLPGIVLSVFLEIHVLFGSILAAIFSAFAMNAIKNKSGLKQDSATYIVFVGMFALGIASLSLRPTFTSDLSHFLIGNPLGVTNQDLLVFFIVTLFTSILLFGLQKELLLASFDPTEAKAIGLPVLALERLLLALIGVVVVLVISLVGTTLSVSMLITGAAAARLFAKNLHYMMIFAAIFGCLGSIIGLYLSYYLNIASGATVILVNTAMFCICLIYNNLLNNKKRPV